MRRMTMKYASRCASCGKELPEGSTAYGQKNASGRGWTFRCTACEMTAKGSSTAAQASQPQADPKPSAFSTPSFTIPAGAEPDFEAMEAILAEQEAPFPKAEPTPPAPKKDLLELLRDGAEWRLS